MKAVNFCKVFIFSVVNLIIFLLSIIFLTSAKNVQDQLSYIEYELKKYREKKNYCFTVDLDKINKHYPGIAALFAFIIVGVCVYLVSLIILIKVEKFDKEGRNNNNYQNYGVNYNYQNNNIYDMPNTNRKMSNQNNQIPIQENDENDAFDDEKYLRWFLLGSFIITQIFYAVELFVLTGYLAEINDMAKKIGDDMNEDCQDLVKELANIYQGSIIVGYILFFIFIISYLYLLLLYNKIGEGAQKRLGVLINSRFCVCCGSCLDWLCISCRDCFSTKTDSEIQVENENKAKNIEEQNIQKIKKIKELEKYKKDLAILNSKYNRGNPSNTELSKLNLMKII
jgi:hypothetical protein